MTHHQHVDLIQNGITKNGGVWADLGSGEGAFTLAIADLLGKDAEIYSIDKDSKRIERQKKQFAKLFHNAKVNFIIEDFTTAIDLPKLDGVLMANSLHYVQEQTEFLTRLKHFLKPHGQLLLVEYNTDVGNPWVPYPISFTRFEQLSKQAGFKTSKLIKKIPSSYWNEMYCALSTIS